MLLQTLDWWPAQGAGTSRQTRARLSSLFPVASLGAAAHTLIAEQEWSLCGRLFEYVIYHQLECGPLTSRDVLSLSVANARLVGHVFPTECRELLDTALAAVASFAGGHTRTRRALSAPREKVNQVRETWSRTERVAAPYRSIEAVAAVLKAAEQSHTYLDLARLAVKVLLRAEAAVASVAPAASPEQRSAARAHIWRTAFLYLDLALSTV